MAEIQAVFLDYYHTLVHFAPAREERQVLVCRELGYDVAQEALRRAYVAAEHFWTLENAERPIFRRAESERAGFYAEYQRILLGAAGIEVTAAQAERIYRRYSELERNVVLFDDVLPALAELKVRGLTVGVISNTDSALDQVCAELGLNRYVDFIVSSCTVGSEKPAEPIFRAALELADCEPDVAIHVGDQLHSDVAGALKVGILPLLLDRFDLLGDVTVCDRIQSLHGVKAFL